MFFIETQVSDTGPLGLLFSVADIRSSKRSSKDPEGFKIIQENVHQKENNVKCI